MHPPYKRLLILEELVLSIIGCNFDKSFIKEVHIFIVDNDIDKTVENTINDIKERFYGIHKIEYFCHLFKGISNVRNELRKKALLLNPDYLVFIDDNEIN